MSDDPHYQREKEKYENPVASTKGKFKIHE